MFPSSEYQTIIQKLTTNPTFVCEKVEPIPEWVTEFYSKKARGRREVEEDMCVFSRLLPYQVEGIKFATENNGKCIIGDDMGLGKTVQAIAVAKLLKESWPVLIICPSTLRYIWGTQLGQWLVYNGVEVQPRKEVVAPPLGKKKGKIKYRPDIMLFGNDPSSGMFKEENGEEPEMEPNGSIRFTLLPSVPQNSLHGKPLSLFPISLGF